METERQLLDAIHGGDQAALRRLYDRFSGYAMAVGLRYIPEREEVCDVLQDSFVKILTGIDRFDYRGEGSLKSWVSRIVANCSIDHMKKNEHLLTTDELPDSAEEEETDVGDIPPDILDRMIGQLPMGYRMVLNLFVFEHLSHKEIAQRLGITESASTSQFFRAKKMLQRMVREYISKQ